jgi:hypothetical protein
MTQPVKFGLNVDPNTGGLPIAERIRALRTTGPAARAQPDHYQRRPRRRP